MNVWSQRTTMWVPEKELRCQTWGQGLPLAMEAVELRKWEHCALLIDHYALLVPL